MADKKELPAFPAEAVEYLEQLDHCINDVQSRLDGQKNSKYVTRFVEKNLLTHKCMNLYDKWRKTHFNWMKEVCHTTHNPEICARMNAVYEAKNEEVKARYLQVYKFSSEEEDRGYRELLERVEKGSKLVEVACPFKSQLGEQVTDAVYNPKPVK